MATETKELLLEKVRKLYARSTISQEEYDEIISSIKGLTSSSTFKNIEKTLRRKIREEDREIKKSPGPTYRDKDLEYLKQKITNFFKSPLSNELKRDFHGEKIKFFLFGSLVNGFCNNPSKPHFGTPSDEGRVSDVDMLVMVSKEVFEVIFSQWPRMIVDINKTRRTLPIGKDTLFGPHFAGPFREIFHDFSYIRFAGKENSPVHLVFIENDFYAESSLEKEPQIAVAEVTT